MKYKDLPNEKILQKLIATSFESPKLNLQVYEWANSILEQAKFVENERIKLVQKYGKSDKDGGFKVLPENINRFSEEFNKVLNLDIEKNIDKCPITKEWFEDDKCQYSSVKDLWISAAEIAKILEFS